VSSDRFITVKTKPKEKKVANSDEEREAEGKREEERLKQQ